MKTIKNDDLNTTEKIRFYTLPSMTYELLCGYILDTLGQNLKKFLDHNVEILSTVSSATRKALLEVSVLHEFSQSHEFNVMPKRQIDGYIYLVFSGKCGVFVNGDKVATLLSGQVFHDCDLDTRSDDVTITVRPVKGTLYIYIYSHSTTLNSKNVIDTLLTQVPYAVWYVDKATSNKMSLHKHTTS